MLTPGHTFGKEAVWVKMVFLENLGAEVPAALGSCRRLPAGVASLGLAHFHQQW